MIYGENMSDKKAMINEIHAVDEINTRNEALKQVRNMKFMYPEAGHTAAVIEAEEIYLRIKK